VENEVIVYCEVENFSSQLDSQKLWERLSAKKSSSTRYRHPGLDARQDRPASVGRPLTHAPPRLLLGRKIRLPANLSIGGYILKVSVSISRSTELPKTRSRWKSWRNNGRDRWLTVFVQSARGHSLAV